jgi:phage repressor protein C with HTH and peptisase S24 domain
MSETIHDRIKRLVDHYGNGANTVFANLIGVSEGNIRGYIKGVVPKQDFLEKVVRNCDVSPEWLLTGVGDMIKDCALPIAHHSTSPKEGIPLIPFSAMAGALKGEQAILEYECERYVVPAFNGADFLMPVKGDSMTPTFLSGDIVACQRVPMSGLFFQWNKPYVLDTAQGAIIKRIKPGSDKQHVLIVSDNKEYDPFELPYEDIYAVALVIGIIRLE